MTKDEALKLALESLERIDLWLKARYSGIGLVGVELDAIAAIKEALALTSTKCEVQPAQVYQDHDDALTIAYQSGYYDGKKAAQPAQEPVAKYSDIVSDGGLDPRNTIPPQRPWVGLTEKEKKEIYRLSVYVEGAISLTEAKLKEKNT